MSRKGDPGGVFSVTQYLPKKKRLNPKVVLLLQLPLSKSWEMQETKNVTEAGLSHTNQTQRFVQTLHLFCRLASGSFNSMTHLSGDLEECLSITVELHMMPGENFWKLSTMLTYKNRGIIFQEIMVNLPLGMQNHETSPSRSLDDFNHHFADIVSDAVD